MITSILNGVLMLLTVIGKIMDVMKEHKIAENISNKAKVRVNDAKEKVRKKLVDRHGSSGLH